MKAFFWLMFDKYVFTCIAFFVETKVMVCLTKTKSSLNIFYSRILDFANAVRLKIP